MKREESRGSDRITRILESDTLGTILAMPGKSVGFGGFSGRKQGMKKLHRTALIKQVEKWDSNMPYLYHANLHRMKRKMQRDSITGFQTMYLLGVFPWVESHICMMILSFLVTAWSSLEQIMV